MESPNFSSLKRQTDTLQKLSLTKSLSVSSLITIATPINYCL